MKGYQSMEQYFLNTTTQVSGEIPNDEETRGVLFEIFSPLPFGNTFYFF